MHPWIQLLSTYIYQQIPDIQNALKTALVLVQSYTDRYHVQSLDDTCQFLSKFQFKTIKEFSLSGQNESTNILPYSDTDDANGSIFVGYLKTNIHNKTGGIMLEDSSGWINTCSTKIDASDINSVIMVTHSIFVVITPNKFLFCFKSVKKNINKYVELHSWIKFNDCAADISVLQGDQMTPFMSISDYKKLTSKPKLVNIKGVVKYKSPIHKAHKHNAFFIISLQCCSIVDEVLSVVIQGSSFMYWYELLHLAHTVQVTNLRVTVIKKGTKEERQLHCNSSNSKFSVLLSTTEKDDIFENSMNVQNDIGEFSVLEGFISYVGVITESKYAEFGLYYLDETVGLVVSHQPQLHFGRGLRIGARIHVFNVHPFQWKKKPVLWCCTKSCIEILDLSTENSPYHPFVAPIHPFASVCQKHRVQDYLWVVDTLIKIKDIMPPNVDITSEDMELVKHILFQFVIPVHDRPSLFSEFLDIPHSCIFTLHSMKNWTSQEATVVSIQEFVEHYEKIAKDEEFQCNWLHGKEFDRCQDYTDKKGNWWYAIMDSVAVKSNLVLCGKITLAAGHLKLMDRSGSINIVIPAVDDTILDRFVLLSSYKVVIEKCSFEELLKKSGKTSRSLMFRVYLIARNEDVLEPMGTAVEIAFQLESKRKLEHEDDRPSKKLVLERNLSGKIEDALVLLLAREFKRHRARYDVEVHDNQRVYVPGMGKATVSDLLSKGVSLYPFTTSILILRLQNVTTGKMISMNVDSNNFPYCFALLPGASFKLSNFDIISGKTGSVYYKLNKNSTMEIHRLPPLSFARLKLLMEEVEEKMKNAAEVRSLHSFVTEDLQKITACRDMFRLFGRIVQIQTVVAKWKCVVCFKGISDECCTPGCKQSRKFFLELRCVIDDGTAEGYLHVEEPNSSKILLLTDESKELLKATSYRFGQIQYYRGSGNKQVMADLKNSSKRQQCEHMLLTHAAKASLSELREFHLRVFKQSGQTGYSTCVWVSGATEYHSLTYRKLTFECLSFRRIEYKRLMKSNLYGEATLS